ncbi:MAG: TetR family transcriptional regulator [Comamonadaceae bacterium]|nr:TetR family transcriptional regulator [Comamonadaceae bacterium]
MAAKPGSGKLQILQTIAEHARRIPKGRRSPPPLLAAKLDVSEAALYRHFASKAQMYEGLIEFIESSLFSRDQQDRRGGATGAQAGRS